MSKHTNLEDQDLLKEEHHNYIKEFRKNQIEFPWHSRWLPKERTGLMLGSELIATRNLALCGLYTQLIATTAGFSLFFARKVIF